MRKDEDLLVYYCQSVTVRLISYHILMFYHLLHTNSQVLSLFIEFFRISHHPPSLTQIFFSLRIAEMDSPTDIELSAQVLVSMISSSSSSSLSHNKEEDVNHGFESDCGYDFLNWSESLGHESVYELSVNCSRVVRTLKKTL